MVKASFRIWKKKKVSSQEQYTEGQAMSIPPHILEFSISSQDTFPNQNSPWSAQQVGQQLPFVLISYSRCCEGPARLPLAHLGGPAT